MISPYEKTGFMFHQFAIPFGKKSPGFLGAIFPETFAVHLTDSRFHVGPVDAVGMRISWGFTTPVM